MSQEYIWWVWFSLFPHLANSVLVIGSNNVCEDTIRVGPRLGYVSSHTVHFETVETSFLTSFLLRDRLLLLQPGC
jgi:hypothetical protein